MLLIKSSKVKLRLKIDAKLFGIKCNLLSVIGEIRAIAFTKLVDASVSPA